MAIKEAYIAGIGPLQYDDSDTGSHGKGLNVDMEVDPSDSTSVINVGGVKKYYFDVQQKVSGTMDDPGVDLNTRRAERDGALLMYVETSTTGVEQNATLYRFDNDNSAGNAEVPPYTVDGQASGGSVASMWVAVAGYGYKFKPGETIPRILTVADLDDPTELSTYPGRKNGDIVICIETSTDTEEKATIYRYDNDVSNVGATPEQNPWSYDDNSTPKGRWTAIAGRYVRHSTRFKGDGTGVLDGIGLQKVAAGNPSAPTASVKPSAGLSSIGVNDYWVSIEVETSPGVWETAYVPAWDKHVGAL